MKKINYLLLVFLFSCAPIQDKIIFNNTIEKEPAKKEKVKASIQNELMIDDFNRKNKNSLKGAVNPWEFNPKDAKQGTRIKYNKEIRMGESGYSLQIRYDVDSPSQAFNGVYWELKEADFSPYNNLVLFVKGDKEKGFTATFKIELKNNNNQTGTYYIQGVTEEWQKIVVPFGDFKGITDFTSMKEFTIVFVDSEVTKKEGVLYMDDLAVIK